MTPPDTPPHTQPDMPSAAPAGSDPELTTGPAGPVDHAVHAERGWGGVRALLSRNGWVAAIAISACVHVLILLVAAVVRIGLGTGGSGAGMPEPIEFAVMTDVELTELAAPDPLRADAPETAPETLSLASLTDFAPIESPKLDTPLEFEPSGASGDPLASFAGDAGSGGAGLGASFFGLEAQGRRFVFIIDVSVSMNSSATTDPGGPTRLEVTKRELTGSITDLLETSEFSVLLFAGDTGALFPRSWLAATQENKLNARRRIGQITTDDAARFGVSNTGSTRPLDAFERVFRMRPRPDAVYFMTDGEFSNDIPEIVRERNARARVPIHCILFSDPTTSRGSRAEALLQTISGDSGGRYALVAGTGR